MLPPAEHHMQFRFTAPADVGLLGYSTFPADYAGNPMDDGSVILFSSLPGGSTDRFNEGKVCSIDIGLAEAANADCSSDVDARSRPLGGPLPHLPGWLQQCRRHGG